MTHLLKALKSFIQIFKLNLSNMNEVITLIINKFLKILETFPVPEGDSENAQNAIRIRRKACTSLLALGLTVPEKLLVFVVLKILCFGIYKIFFFLKKKNEATSLCFNKKKSRNLL